MRMKTYLIRTIVSLSFFLLVACKSPKEASVVLTTPEGIDFGKIVLRQDEDETRFDLQLTGLEPNAIYNVKLFGGSCDNIGASSSVLCTLRSDPFGEAKTSGSLTYRGHDPITLEQLNDQHVLVIQSSEQSFCSVFRIR
jgi:hypothetical protein